jgi:uncharacterized repeat protein (TIGR01451 family)
VLPKGTGVSARVPATRRVKIRLFGGAAGRAAVFVGLVGVIALPGAQSYFAAVRSTPTSGSYRDTVLSDGPTSYWRLGEASGSVAADERSLNPGTYRNGVALGQPGAIAGDPNTSAAFDGVDDYMRVPYSPSLSTNAFTVELWVYSSGGSGSYRYVAAFGDNSPPAVTSGWRIRLSPSDNWQLQIGRPNGSGYTDLTGPPLVFNQWNHVVASYDGSEARLYLNDALVATATTQYQPNTRLDLLLANVGAYAFAGMVDELAVYPTALSATRVDAHSQAANAVDSTAPVINLKAPADGSTMDAAPSFAGSAGTAAGDSSTVTVKIYAGSSATGTPIQTLTTSRQPAGTFSVKATAVASGTYTAQAEQTDQTGNLGKSNSSTFAIDAELDPTMLLAGDISACDTTGDEATAVLLDRLPGTVAPIGDLAYEYGTASDFANCYDPSWGRHKARTRPVTGGHDYLTTNATPYYDYFGAAAGDPSKGYYSYELGAWHIVSLNSVCEQVGGCGTGSAQEQWLRSDLASHPAMCTLAYFHNPRFSSGAEHGSDAAFQPFWQDLYDANADLILDGFDHIYERFAPQTPAGASDPIRGIREIVVGTGGRSHYPFGSIQPNSEVRNNDTFGVLKATLHPTSYDWQFVPEAGHTFTDSGSSGCHGRLSDLSVSQTDSPDPVNVRQMLTYSVTVGNRGPATASAVSLADNLPANTSFVSADSTQGSCTPAAGTVTCDLGVLASGDSATVDIKVTPQNDGTIRNEATVTANEPDSDTSNNSASEETTVVSPYPRPGSGSPLRVPLVPEFSPCSDPNSVHVIPLSLPSCAPPVLESPLLTTSNTGKGGSFARFDVFCNGGTPGELPPCKSSAGDQEDVNIASVATDVRNASNGSDYAGEVLLSTAIRVTDRANGASQSVPATIGDIQFSIPIECIATPDPNFGSSCSLSTTADTLIPGFAIEDKRAVISAFSVELLDTGVDGHITPSTGACPPTCGSGDENTFLHQGLFAP